MMRLLPSHARRCSAPLVSTSVALLLVLPAPATAHAQEAGRSIIPVNSQWPGARPGQIDITEDGRYVVFGANRGDGWRQFVHEIGQPTSREYTGLGAVPYFGHISPDGHWLLFGKKGWIWKTPVDGGPLTLLYTTNNFKAWETDTSLIVSKGTGGIWRVKADGSRLDERLAVVDTSTGATNYGRPSLLPDGKGVLVSVGFGTGLDLRRIGIVSLTDGGLTLLDEYGINPRYSASGHILYTQGNTLKAIPFDVGTLRVRGPAATVVEGIHVYSNQASQFDISQSGTLVYVEGPSELGRQWVKSLVWVDREGREYPFDSPAEKLYWALRLSPDGRYLAAEVGTGLQLFDRRTGTWTVLAESGNTGAPVWSTTGDTLFYSKAGVLGRQVVGSGGAWEQLWKGDQQFWAFSMAPEGRLLGTEWHPTTGLWRMTTVGVAGPGRATSSPLLGPTDVIRRNPAVSPDGKWIAYVEKKGGLDNVYVQPYPAGGPALLVSAGAVGEAAEPIWGRSAAEVFYRDGKNMVSVQFASVSPLRVARRTTLFSVRDYVSYLNTFATVHDYDPRTDRFLMLRWVIPDLPGTDIRVIENAFDLLNRIAPREEASGRRGNGRR